MINDIAQFVESWLTAWNQHDLPEIMSHYSDKLEIYSPMLIKLGITATGKLQGKPVIAEYWQQALIKFPDLHFKLSQVTVGVDCLAISYQSVLNLPATEIMFWDTTGQIYKVIACYGVDRENTL
ncbi:nuclear transport factor 2 family protein [Methylophaga sp.]|uniref:nuclear transport factor 2 family protein n=1 Tax=Methylophaga sp. TaxID=2024840 RepID=UPI00271B92E9|nr:nuclear transport factor 2 family protein [Methylophaga sp.]MDO8826231.1 nuclear transport factor 2 family protein [Methylophaga sp.]